MRALHCVSPAHAEMISGPESGLRGSTCVSMHGLQMPCSWHRLKHRLRCRARLQPSDPDSRLRRGIVTCARLSMLAAAGHPQQGHHGLHRVQRVQPQEVPAQLPCDQSEHSCHACCSGFACCETTCVHAHLSTPGHQLQSLCTHAVVLVFLTMFQHLTSMCRHRCGCLDCLNRACKLCMYLGIQCD